MQKYRMRIAYDGSEYSGWQIQLNSHSIQGAIEDALKLRLKQSIRIVGAGRTDAGVHALGQVAHFSTEEPIICHKLVHALNGILPPTIRIKELAPTDSTFHAQISAQSKEYHYHLWLERIIDPFYRFYRHHFFDTRFSLERLKEGLPHFVGKHDFATFANVGGNVSSTERRIMRLELFEQEGGVRLEFEGDGFLYKMVRNIVGTLLDISIGKREAKSIAELLLAKDRRKAAAAAAPRGLFLVKINYPATFSALSSTKEG